MKRAVKVVVISDVHLGTFGCHAKELLKYLQSIEPEVLVINGDFIDGWQFRKSYFPLAHIQIIYEIMRKSMSGTRVYYLAGNHDHFIRKFIPFYSGNIFFRDQLELDIGGKRHLFFHGDVFDMSVQISPFLAKLAGFGYDNLIKLNTLINRVRLRFGLSRISFAHMAKNRLKQAVKFIHNFERLAVIYAQQRNMEYVICGHIHTPKMVSFENDGKELKYLNSGDWIENLTALEYRDGKWSIYKYEEFDYEFINPRIMIADKPAAFLLDFMLHKL